MAKDEKKSIRHPCASCGDNRLHDVLFTANWSSDPDIYHYAERHMIVECRGCEKRSFRYVYEDYEQAYPDENNDWEVPKEVEVYPRSIKGHRSLNGLYHVPEIVRDIYQESLKAIQEDASILAGLGLRGTVEAICNDTSVTGRSLEVRISKLATQGLISQKDAERLHAIRFLGNDAAHDIKKPTPRQIDVALKIIEHLIMTVYILDKESAGTLDTIITDYKDFKKILCSCLSDFSSGDEYPLAKFLGKNVRRIKDGLSPMEANLISDIQSGNFNKLLIGKMDTYSNSPSPLQHFEMP